LETGIIIDLFVRYGPLERDDLFALEPLPLPEPVNGEVLVGLRKRDAGADDPPASV